MHHQCNLVADVDDGNRLAHAAVLPRVACCPPLEPGRLGSGAIPAENPPPDAKVSKFVWVATLWLDPESAADPSGAERCDRGVRPGGFCESGRDIRARSRQNVTRPRSSELTGAGRVAQASAAAPWAEHDHCKQKSTFGINCHTLELRRPPLATALLPSRVRHANTLFWRSAGPRAGAHDLCFFARRCRDWRVCPARWNRGVAPRQVRGRTQRRSRNMSADERVLRVYVVTAAGVRARAHGLPGRHVGLRAGLPVLDPVRTGCRSARMCEELLRR